MKELKELVQTTEKAQYIILEIYPNFERSINVYYCLDKQIDFSKNVVRKKKAKIVRLTLDSFKKKSTLLIDFR